MDTPSPAFASWFGASKVVHPVSGEPLVVYHGSPENIFAFDPARLGAMTGADDAKAGFFFAENPTAADQFTWKNGEKVGSLYPTYLSIQNPSIIEDLLLDGAGGTTAGKRLRDARAAGHDGAIFTRSDMLGHTGRVFVAFHPTQIKSAVGNVGTFNPSDPDIRFSQPNPDAGAPLPPNIESLPLAPVSNLPSDLQQKIARLEAAGQSEGAFSIEAAAELPDVLAAMDPLYGAGETLQRASPVFFSALSHSIGISMPRNKRGGVLAKSALEWIDARAREGKLFKESEVEWSGIREWLRMQRQWVAVADVVRFVDLHGVKVSEVMFSGETEQELHYVARRAGDAFRNALGALNGALIIDGRRYTAANILFGLTDGELKVEELPPELQSSAQNWVRATRAADSFISDEQTTPRYARHTLPYGEDYRELLLTLPPQRMDTSAWTATSYRDGWYGVKDEVGRPIANMYGETPDEAIEAARDYFQSAPEHRRDYISHHWSDVPNVLCHVRFNTRTDGDGAKVFFVEEIQADWAQTARKVGFRPDLRPTTASAIDLDDETPYAWILRDTANNTSLRVSRADYEYSGGINKAINDFALMQIRKYEGVQEKPPEAPFMRETKDWVALAVKRIMRYACENGFEKVAFINATQAIERNGLRQAVDKLTLTREATGDIAIVAHKIGDEDETPIATCRPDKLVDYIGKELAAKASAWPAGSDRMVFNDLDLEIGGHGMEVFYSEIVPQVVNSLLKKHGGERLAPIAIRTRDPFMPGVYSIESDSSGQFHLARKGERLATDYPTYEEADDARLRIYIDEESGATSQLAFTITPALKAKVMDGMPLFSRSAENETPALTLPSEDLPTVQVLAEFFRARAVIVRTTADSRFVFNGAHHGDVLWLNERSPRPLHAVFGHELVHKMRRDRPDLYDALSNALDPLLANENAYAARNGLFARTSAFVREELIADIVADRFTERAFWKMVARASQQRFHDLAGFVTQTVNNLLERFKPTPFDPSNSEPPPKTSSSGTAEFVRDLGKARAAITSVLMAYVEWLNDQDPRPPFSESLTRVLRSPIEPSAPPPNHPRPKTRM